MWRIEPPWTVLPTTTSDNTIPFVVRCRERNAHAFFTSFVYIIDDVQNLHLFKRTIFLCAAGKFVPGKNTATCYSSLYPYRIWWRISESNRWPSACKADALANWANPPDWYSDKFLLITYRSPIKTCWRKLLNQVDPTRFELVTPTLSV